jgi:hypothetical protein
MSTSGTSSFNLTFNEIAEECYERCGVEMRSGYQLRTARRSMNLMTIEWANRGINLWTIEQGEIPLVQGQVAYALPDGTIDLLDHVIRQNQATNNQQDINITRISESTYSTIPNKLAQGRPIQVWINRQTNATYTTSVTLSSSITATATSITVSNASSLGGAGFIKIDNEQIYYTSVLGNVLQLCNRGQNGTTAASHTAGAVISVVNSTTINIWPTANAGGSYTFVYWRMRRIQDAGSGTKTEDIPFRFLPCLIAGLSYYLAIKSPEAADRIAMLKSQYDEQWRLAADEDREKASLRLAPRQMFF